MRLSHSNPQGPHQIQPLLTYNRRSEEESVMICHSTGKRLSHRQSSPSLSSSSIYWSWPSRPTMMMILSILLMISMIMTMIEAAPTNNTKLMNTAVKRSISGSPITKLQIKVNHQEIQRTLNQAMDEQQQQQHRRRKRSITSDIGAMHYLQRFGYMNTSIEGDASASQNLISENIYSNAIMEFQRFAGLNESGVLDEDTIHMMNAPRCGNKDLDGIGEEAHSLRRRKRYALQGSKWRRTDLTYRISQYPTKNNIKRSDIDREIARAFQIWSDVTPLNFHVRKEGRVHIDIRFATGEHGDGDPFDGPGNTLAHAYFPQYGGDAHFDNEEFWTVSSYSGTNIFQVAAHELGHSLGLGHSSAPNSLMAPFYQKYKPKFKLHQDDILAIQALYGVRPGTDGDSPKESTPSRPSDPSGSSPDDGPDLCQESSIDAVTRTADGSTYVFKGDYYWRIETNGIANGYPRKISTDWDGLSGNLNAALTWADGKTFFFKGNKYWRFKNMRMDKGYPKLISTGFAGIPDNVDAAFVWGGNGKTYFFKGSEYWRFDSKTEPPVSKQYPKPIKHWINVPNRIDAAFRWENGMTYFFKGTQYYRFNDIDFEVDQKAKPPFPRQTAQWWFDCQLISRKLKERPTRKSNGIIDGLRSTFFRSDNNRPMASALHSPFVNKSDTINEWRMHGRPETDELIDDHLLASNSSDIQNYFENGLLNP